MNLTVRTATRLVAANVLSAVGQDGISRALLAPYAVPLATVIHAEARAALIPTPAAASRIGLLDFLTLALATLMRAKPTKQDEEARS